MPEPRRRTVVSRSLSWFFRCIECTFIVFFVALALHWFGLNQPGDHDRNLMLRLDSEVRSLESLLGRHVASDSLLTVPRDVLAWIDTTSERIQRQSSRILPRAPRSHRERSTTERSQIQSAVRFDGSNTTLAVQLFAVRLLVIVCGLPLVLGVCAVAVVDGLIQRSIRRKAVGRESAQTYHIAKFALIPCLLVAWAAYLLFPGVVNPLWGVLPTAGVVGLVSFVMSAWFKKYI